MKLIKPIKIIRQKCDGSEEEELDIDGAFFHMNREIDISRQGQLEKIEQKLDILNNILSTITESISDKETITTILNILSNNSEYHSYFLKED